MFVSSYNTYISTDTTKKNHNSGVNYKKNDSESFGSKLLSESYVKQYTVKNLPIDYVSNYKSFNNQLKLQEQTINQDEIKLKKIKDIQDAKVAYEENSVMFPLVKKPTITIYKTNIIDSNLPENIQKLKEENLRHTMVNTYIENDKYYQVTA